MIRLDVADYCHNCTRFEADVQEPVKAYAGGDVIHQTDTIVRCENRHHCEYLRRYFEHQLKEEK